MTTETETRTRIEVEVGPELFSFSSLQEWVNKGQSWFRRTGRPEGTSLCVAADGGVVRNGKGFMEADRRGAFPVRVYAVDY